MDKITVTVEEVENGFIVGNETNKYVIEYNFRKNGEALTQAEVLRYILNLLGFETNDNMTRPVVIVVDHENKEIEE